MRILPLIALLWALGPAQAMGQQPVEPPPPSEDEAITSRHCIDWIAVGTFDVVSTIRMGGVGDHGQMWPTIFLIRVKVEQPIWRVGRRRTVDTEYSGAPIFGEPPASLLFRARDARGHWAIRHVEGVAADAGGRRFLPLYGPGRQSDLLPVHWRRFARRVDIMLNEDFSRSVHAVSGYSELRGNRMIVYWGIPIDSLARMFATAPKGNCERW